MAKFDKYGQLVDEPEDEDPRDDQNAKKMPPPTPGQYFYRPEQYPYPPVIPNSQPRPASRPLSPVLIISGLFGLAGMVALIVTIMLLFSLSNMHEPDRSVLVITATNALDTQALSSDGVAEDVAGNKTRTPESTEPAPLPLTIISGLIAFSSDSDGDRDLYALDPNNLQSIQITNEPGDEWYPAWSPNACSLAFSHDRGDQTPEIYIIDALGNAPRLLTDNNASNYKPAWSRNDQIAFHANIADPGDFDIYVIDANGSNLQNLTAASTAKEEAPAWSPDGTTLAFVSNRSGSDHIYLMNADGSSVTQLTSGSWDDKAPAWSPDGERISFTSNRTGNSDIYVMHSDGSNQQQITSDPAEDWFATWSPDGALLAFISLRSSPIWDLYLTNGSDIVRLTDSADQDLEPAWSSVACKLSE